MKSRTLALTALSLLCISPILAGDMTLVIRGDQSVVLHEDNYWEFEKVQPPLEEDFPVYLNDGRIIMICADYTWLFVDKAKLKEANNITVDNVYAKGTAQSRVLAEATANANKSAIHNATKKLRASLRRKPPFEKLKDCVRRVEKEVDTQESFTTGKGWEVSVAVTLDKGSILAVVDCAEAKPEPAVKKQ